MNLEDVLLDADLIEPEDFLERKIWVTKDGRFLLPHEIDDKHLENLIVYCDKEMIKDPSTSDWFGAWAKIFNEERARRDRT